ncbi:MAG: DUF1566 domain-containing protein [Pseudomonadota bacterium]
MRTVIGFSLTILLLMGGCSGPKTEDPQIFKPEGYKRYDKPKIDIEDSLASKAKTPPAGETPDLKARSSDNIQSAQGVVKDPEAGLEWIAGPDRDTTWDQARGWVKSLAGGEWRMPTLNELKTLYKEGAGTRNMTPALKTTGWYVWSGETKESNMASYFFFEWGIDGSIIRSFSADYRGFAVRQTGKN